MVGLGNNMKMTERKIKGYVRKQYTSKDVSKHIAQIDNEDSRMVRQLKANMRNRSCEIHINEKEVKIK